MDTTKLGEAMNKFLVDSMPKNGEIEMQAKYIVTRPIVIERTFDNKKYKHQEWMRLERQANDVGGKYQGSPNAISSEDAKKLAGASGVVRLEIIASTLLQGGR